jgi:hypothetical protein
VSEPRDLIKASLDAIHRQNTGRPINCLICGVTFIGPQSAATFFDHDRSHSMSHHPSVPR